MGVITSSTFAKALWPGVNAWYGKAYSEYPQEWVELFEKYTSKKAFEEDVGLSSFGYAYVKPEGSPINYDTERQGFTTRYNHVVYALGFIVTREAYEDDQYEVIGQRKAKGLAFSIRQTKETIAANVYNRAFNSSYKGGDNVQLVSNAHPNVAGGTWSNTPSTQSDLSEASLEQAVIDISGWTNDRGLKIAVRPKQLIIPYQEMFNVERILKTTGRVGTDLNDVNAIKNMGMFTKVTVNHYLTDADAWFIRTDVPEGMKYFERRGDAFEMDNDFDTENAKYKASFRCSFGWSDPKAIYASQGA